MPLTEGYYERMREDFEKRSSREYKDAIKILGNFYTGKKISKEKLEWATKIIERELEVSLIPPEEDIKISMENQNHQKRSDK